MDTNTAAEKWFALQVKTRWEGSTESLLRGKGYETFLPTYKGKVSRNGRTKESVLALFPGYVFCRFDSQKRLPILVTPGVISVVGNGKLPIPVEDSEIEAINAVVRSGLPAQPWPYLEVGDRVRIEGEVLGGLEGILISFRGTQRIVVSVALLRRSVALEIERSRILPLRSPRLAAGERVHARSLIGEGIT